jgi:hypothetical protein
MSLYTDLVHAGVPLDSHESDLYALVTATSNRIIAKYEHRKNVTTFVSQGDRRLWYDIPFAYEPFWERKARHNPTGHSGACRICRAPYPKGRVVPLCDRCLRKMGYDTPTGHAYKKSPKGFHRSGSNPRGRSLWKIRTVYKYQYAPGVLDIMDPTVMKGHRIPPGEWVRLLAKRPAGGRAIRGWSRTFAWIADAYGNEQIVFKRALHRGN